MKRTLSLLLALVMVVSMIPAVFAETDDPNIGFDEMLGTEAELAEDAVVNKEYTTRWDTHYYALAVADAGKLQFTVENGTVTVDGNELPEDGIFEVLADATYTIVVTKTGDVAPTWSATYAVDEETNNADSPIPLTRGTEYTTEEYDVTYYTFTSADKADLNRVNLTTDGTDVVVQKSDGTVVLDSKNGDTYFDTEKSTTYTVIVTGKGTAFTLANSPIRMSSAALQYKEMIQIQYKFKVTNLPTEKTVDGYGLLVFDSLDKAKEFNHANASQYELVLNGTTYEGKTEGISARLMDENQYAVGFVKYTDGSYDYSVIMEYSPMIYAKNMYTTSTNQNTVDLCEALAHYGAAAQAYLDGVRDPDLLMDKSFPEFDYDESVLGTKILSTDTNSYNGLRLSSASMLFKAAITVQVKYRISDITAFEEVPYVKYTLNGGEEKTVVMVDSGTTHKSGDPIYIASIAGIAAKDMDEPLTVDPYYTVKGADAESAGGKLVYSGYEYCRAIINSSSDEYSVALAKAFAMYIYAADKALDN